MKLTKKQIEIIIEQTRKDIKGKSASLYKTLGYYMPSNANWSYQAGWTYEGDLVVTQFGIIR